MAPRRRVEVLKNDVLVFNGTELDVSILEEMFKADNRLLWAFVKNDDGDIMPIPFTEDKVLWLTPGDLVRDKSEVL